MEHGGFPVSSSFVPSRSSSYFRAIVNQPEGGGYGERGRCLSKPEVVRNPRILARGGFYGAPDATCAAHICIPSSPRTRESPSAEFPRLPSSLSLSLSPLLSVGTRYMIFHSDRGQIVSRGWIQENFFFFFFYFS